MGRVRYFNGSGPEVIPGQRGGMVAYVASVIGQALGQGDTPIMGILRFLAAAFGGYLAEAWSTVGDPLLQHPATVALVLFWFLDWGLGTALALMERDSKGRRNWRPRRSLYSFVKLGIWLSVLAVAHGFVAVGDMVLAAIGGGIMSLVVLTEGLSVLRNAAELDTIRSGGQEPSSKLLRLIYRVIHRELDRRMEKLEELGGGEE